MAFGASETQCRSCGNLYPNSDLDRYLYCLQCRKRVNRRGAWWGRLAGLVAGAGLAVYLVIRVHPSGRFMAFYAVMLVVTYVIIHRIAVAVVQGYYRSRSTAPAERPN